MNCPYLDGIHNWFAVPTMDMSEEVYNENLIYNTYISAYNFKGFSVGSGCPVTVHFTPDSTCEQLPVSYFELNSLLVFPKGHEDFLPNLSPLPPVQHLHISHKAEYVLRTDP